MISAYVIAIVAILVASTLAVVIVLPAIKLASHLGRLFESNIKPVLMPARHLDLLALQRRMVAAALTAVTVSVAGERYLASELRVQVSPKDKWRLANNVEGGVDRVATDLAVEVGRRAMKLGYTVPADLRVIILESAFVVDGRPTRAQAEQRIEKASESKPAKPVSSGTRPISNAASPTQAPKPPSLPLAGTRLAATRRWDGAKDRPGDGGDTTVNSDEATLVPELGGPAVRLSGRCTTIGRKENGHRCDVAIDHPTVSSAHADVRCNRGIWSVIDGRSTNGTYVNGIQIRRQDLTDGDRVQFSTDGPTFVFRLRTPSAARDQNQADPVGALPLQRSADTRVANGRTAVGGDVHARHEGGRHD